jgi:hypothetical protein
MTAKLMSRSICFEPISKSALYQGTTLVGPLRAIRTKALESRENSSFTNLVPKGRLNFRAVQVSELTMFGVPFIH